MSRFQTELVGPWGQQDIGGEVAHVPQAAIDFRLSKWTDVTGQPAPNLPPAPNLFVLQAMLEERELQRIRLDSRFHCLWCRSLDGPAADAEPPDEKMPDLQATRLRDLLSQNDLDAGAIEEALGTDPNGTRRQVAERIKVWLKTRPKAAADAPRSDTAA